MRRWRRRSSVAQLRTDCRQARSRGGPTSTEAPACAARMSSATRSAAAVLRQASTTWNAPLAASWRAASLQAQGARASLTASASGGRPAIKAAGGGSGGWRQQSHLPRPFVAPETMQTRLSARSIGAPERTGPLIEGRSRLCKHKEHGPA